MKQRMVNYYKKKLWSTLNFFTICNIWGNFQESFLVNTAFLKRNNTYLKIVLFYVEINCQLDATDFFYCKSYCLLNMFRAPLCPSSGAREYYTVGCRLWSLVLGFQVVGMVWS
jgi:hypothetical protein